MELTITTTIKFSVFPTKNIFIHNTGAMGAIGAIGAIEDIFSIQFPKGSFIL